MSLTIGLVTFPDITQLDLTGPYEVFSRLPGAKTELVWKTLDPVLSDTGMTLTPMRRFADAPAYDVIVVPGGPGQQGLMDDDATLDFLRAQAATARWVMSVCTGSLVLGAAGLLGGKRATCHWLSLPLLAGFGATPVAERVVFDGALVTTAGVSAGIDGALALVDRLAGRPAAETIQLSIEYDPQPLYSAGSPETAPADLTERIRAFAAPMLKARAEGVRAAAARLKPQETET